MIQFLNNGKGETDTSDATATPDDIISPQTAYVKGEKIQGTMPNNETLEYEPSDEEQKIPLGYTSGGIIKPVDITKLQDYKVSDNLAKGILGDKKAYIEIQYIESTGTQYIDSGIKGSSSLNIYADMQLTKAGNQTTLFGCSYLTDKRNNRLNLYTHGGNSIYFYFGNIGTYYNYQESQILERHTFNANKNLLYVDDVLKITEHTGTFTSDNNIFIFAANDEGQAIQNSSLRLYSFKIYSNGILVRDLIPIMDFQGKACMYDKVDGEFYYNQGTGNFIAGEAI